MEDGVRKSGLLTASKVLAIIQAVTFGICLPLLGLSTLGGMMIGTMFLSGTFIYYIVVFILSILGAVYTSKAQRYWCREYCTIAGGLFIISSVMTLSLFSILCACFCMSERKKMYSDQSIRVKPKIITWSIIGGISVIVMFVTLVLGIADMAKGTIQPDDLPDTNSIEEDYDSFVDSDTSDYEDTNISDENEDLDTEEDSKVTDNSNTPQEYKNALEAAQIYAGQMNFSKAELIDMMTTSVEDYGEGFSEEATEYALENLVDVDFKENALKTAKIYYYDLGLSKEKVRETLVSEFGDKFTEEEADYAIENLE